jgi:hypothetical protein
VEFGTITPPAGWTVIEEGTVGTAIQWCLLWIVSDGSVDQTVTYSGLPENEPATYALWEFANAEGWEPILEAWSGDAAAASGSTLTSDGGPIEPWSVTWMQYTHNGYTSYPHYTADEYSGAMDRALGIWTDGKGYANLFIGTNGAARVGEADWQFYAEGALTPAWWSASIGWVPA